MVKFPHEWLATSTAMPRPPKDDGLKAETVQSLGLQDIAGMLVESTPVILPASSLPPDEFEARIKAHQERVAREMSVSLKREQGRTKSPLTSGKSKTPALPGKTKYGDLKIVSCARCSRTLLGESQEPLRAAAIAKGSRLARNFPPPVAARMHGERPYCGGCAAYYDDPHVTP